MIARCRAGFFPRLSFLFFFCQVGTQIALFVKSVSVCLTLDWDIWRWVQLAWIAPTFWHWVTLKAGIPWKEVVVVSNLKESCSIGRFHVLKYTIWFLMLVLSRINRFWEWTVPKALLKSVWNVRFNDSNESKSQFSSHLWKVYIYRYSTLKWIAKDVNLP